MAGGRPRKPHRLRALEGGRGKSRPLTPDRAAPSDPLEPPPGLPSVEREAWARHADWLRRLKLESGVDAGQFEAMIRHYCRARAADQVLEKGGLSMPLFNSDGDEINACKRPEVAISYESWRLYAQLADKFGMSPAARAKLGAEPKAPERPGDVPPELRDASGGGA